MDLLSAVQSATPTADPELLKEVIARNFVPGDRQLTVIRSILSEDLSSYISPWTRTLYRLSNLYPTIPINRIAIILRRNWNLGPVQAYEITLKNLQRFQSRPRRPLSKSY